MFEKDGYAFYIINVNTRARSLFMVVVKLLLKASLSDIPIGAHLTV